jgi:hypothetical protein
MLKNIGALKLVVFLSPVAYFDSVFGYAAGLNSKPSGTTPVFT